MGKRRVPVLIRPSQNRIKVERKKSRRQLYGGARITKAFTYEELQPYIISDTTGINISARFTYIDHVNDIDILAYPSEAFLHTSIPIHQLFEIISVTNAKKIAPIHKICLSSRCSVDDVRQSSQNHSCLACAKYSTIFSQEKSTKQLGAERVIKLRKKSDHHSKQSCKSKAATKSTNASSAPILKSDKASEVIENDNFPPNPLDKIQAHTIMSAACKKMLPENIEEGGCAVCGELYPIKNLSRLKNIKNLLHILQSPGVTRTERKDETLPIREYSGPVLDYTCHRICDSCRASIEKVIFLV
jgi:hypothetical protein